MFVARNGRVDNEKVAVGQGFDCQKHGKSRILRIQTHFSHIQTRVSRTQSLILRIQSHILRIQSHILRIQSHKCLFLNKVDT